MNFFSNLFETDFMPHGHCYFWRPEILWPTVLGDFFTSLSYFLIPFLLYRFVKDRKDIEYPGVYWAFAIFILSCGITHLLAIISVWHPLYRLEAVAKVITALVSVGTVGLLFKLYRPILAIPSPKALAAVNEELREEIHRRKETEEQLRISEHYFRASMEFAPAGMALLDKEGNWIQVNSALCKMLGYQEEELLTKNFQSITHPDDLSKDLETMQKLLSNEEEGDFLEKRYIKKDGSEIWVILGVSLVKGTDQRPLYFVSQIIDITASKAKQKAIEELNVTLENKVKERTARLEEINAELESFNYSVAHDLRGPLRTTEGLIAMAKDAFKSEVSGDLRQIMDHIAGNTARMDQLITEFLNFSKVGQQALDHSEINLEAMFSEVYQEAMAAYPGRTVSFEIEPLPLAFGDKILLRQVLQNLISNALKYTSKNEKTNIKVSGTRSKKGITFSVQDNGVGFNPTYKSKLFKMYQRLHTKEQFSGYGIGLALAHRIVKRHKGEIWAESKPGQGATFYVSLPYVGQKK